MNFLLFLRVFGSEENAQGSEMPSHELMAWVAGGSLHPLISPLIRWRYSGVSGFRLPATFELLLSYLKSRVITQIASKRRIVFLRLCQISIPNQPCSPLSRKKLGV